MNAYRIICVLYVSQNKLIILYVLFSVCMVIMRCISRYTSWRTRFPDWGSPHASPLSPATNLNLKIKTIVFSFEIEFIYFVSFGTTGQIESSPHIIYICIYRHIHAYINIYIYIYTYTPNRKMRSDFIFITTFGQNFDAICCRNSQHKICACVLGNIKFRKSLHKICARKQCIMKHQVSHILAQDMCMRARKQRKFRKSLHKICASKQRILKRNVSQIRAQYMCFPTHGVLGNIKFRKPTQDLTVALMLDNF